jgi:hypothetical protein
MSTMGVMRSTTPIAPIVLALLTLYVLRYCGLAIILSTSRTASTTMSARSVVRL